MTEDVLARLAGSSGASPGRGVLIRAKDAPPAAIRVTPVGSPIFEFLAWMRTSPSESSRIRVKPRSERPHARRASAASSKTACAAVFEVRRRQKRS